MKRDLPTLVRQERERLGLSLRQVADRSEGLLSPSNLHAIERGERENVEDSTLDGLARGLGLPVQVIESAAGVPATDEDTPFVLPRRANRLTRREREHVLDLIDLLLARRSR